VRGQIFDSSFTRTPVTIVTSTTFNSIKPCVANLGKTNKIVFTWNDWTNDFVQFRIFDYTGTAVTAQITASSVHTNGGAQMFDRVASNSNGIFLLAWQVATAPSGDIDVRGRFYDATGNPVTNDVLLSPSNSYDNSQPDVCALSNDNIVLVYHGNSSGNYDIYFKIFDPTGSVVKTDTIANFATTSDQTRPYCSGLKNGGFVVVFNSKFWGNTSDIAFRIFDNSGNPKSTNDVKVNTVVGAVDTISALLNGFVVGYEGNSNAYFQIFDADGISVFPETKVNVSTTNAHGQTQVAGFDNKIAIFFINNDGGSWDTYYRAYNIQVCYDFQIYAGMNVLNPVIFSTLTTAAVKITTFPTLGGVYDSTGKALDNTTFYQKTEVNYKITTASTANDSFKYIAISGEANPCKVDIVMCYASCAACTSVGSTLDHKCSKCLPSYYPLVDKSTQCFKNTDIVSGYYFDSVNSVFVFAM
jgi:hypothetical protein